MAKSVVAVLLVATLVALPFMSETLAQPSSYASMTAASSTKLEAIRDRFDRLEQIVYSTNWNDIISYIHGPLGEIRRDLRMLTIGLDKTKKEAVTNAANSLFKSLVKIDIAAKERNASALETAFKNSVTELDSIIDLVS
ncbi:MAG: photosystem II protein PsbQ [Pseudanabaenaceae cyanobacterium bins.39]|nr:photosystem II protein PsbQ [Pseudanabaenaceae cyanobacterium bins.39]